MSSNIPPENEIPEEAPETPESIEIPEPSPNFSESHTVEESSEAWVNEKIQPVEETTEDKEEQTEWQPESTTVSLSASEERSWAMIAHLSVLLNLITGFLGIVAAIIIYFIYKDRSRFVAYHAMQSFIFQCITWLGAGLIAGILIGTGSALAFLIIPLLCLIPGFLILLLIPASLIYGIIGGVKVNNGEDFRYWQVGDWVRDILEPKPIQKL